LEAGKLRSKVTIQNPYNVEDVFGAVVDTWATYKQVWASIEPLTGKENFDYLKENEEITGKIRIRYLRGVNAKMRVKLGSRYWEIVNIIDVNERHKEMIILVKELVRNV